MALRCADIARFWEKSLGAEFSTAKKHERAGQCGLELLASWIGGFTSDLLNWTLCAVCCWEATARKDRCETGNWQSPFLEPWQPQCLSATLVFEVCHNRSWFLIASAWLNVPEHFCLFCPDHPPFSINSMTTTMLTSRCVLSVSY